MVDSYSMLNDMYNRHTYIYIAITNIYIYIHILHKTCTYTIIIYIYTSLKLPAATSSLLFLSGRTFDPDYVPFLKLRTFMKITYLLVLG